MQKKRIKESPKTRIDLPELESIPATEAKNRFGDLLYNITLDGAPRVIERNGRPVAVFMRYQDYLDLCQRAGSKPTQ
ncbi:MAG: type II toxin-antitoxin system Phd/YefM family antitoxin [Candidatus Lindowbacteria bacterium]|nr:type II toxin-antitoxin system Phd/YefM family antitoxin [Candidatus Lindowbacteria bacterium]